MKLLIPLLMIFTSFGPALFASAAPPLKFDSKIALPALLLLEGVKEGSPPIVDEAAEFFRREASSSKVPRKVVSTMPVISPDIDVDYKLRLVAPDESVDHKMVIKAPGIEASK